MIDVTQALMELDGITAITEQVRCPKCVEVYRSIYDKLSVAARAEMDAHQEEMVKIVVSDPGEMTLRMVINRALMTPMEGDKLTPEKGVERFLLATKVHGNKQVELDSSEKTLIKERIAKLFLRPLVIGQACIMLDRAMKKSKKGAS